MLRQANRKICCRCLTNYAFTPNIRCSARCLTNYAFTPNIVHKDHTESIYLNLINYLNSNTLRNKITQDLQPNKRPFTFNYIVKREGDALKCGPVVLSCDLEKSEEKEFILKMLDRTGKGHRREYRALEILPDNQFVSMKEQSVNLQSQHSFEIHAYPSALHNEVWQDFNNAATKYLESLRLINSAPKLPTVQLRNLHAGHLRPSVLYHPQTPAQFYKCVLLNSFYKQWLYQDRNGERKSFQIRIGPIDINHHVNVANNSNVVCILQRQKTGAKPTLTTQQISALCAELGVIVPSDNILEIGDINRTYYLKCEDEEDAGTLVDQLLSLTQDKTGKEKIESLDEAEGQAIETSGVIHNVMSGGLVFNDEMFYDSKPVRHDRTGGTNKWGAMFCKNPPANSARRLFARQKGVRYVPVDNPVPDSDVVSETEV